MSSLSANQHLRVYVSDHVEGLAVADLSALTEGQISFIAAATGAGTALPPAEPFMVAFKDAKGVVHTSPLVNPADVIRQDAALVAPVAAVQKVQELVIPAAPVAGDSYILKVRVPGYGGLVGPEDEVFFYGNHVVKTGDDATAVADGLVNTLNKQLAKAPEPFITAVAAAGTITVTGLVQPYEQAKWQGKHVDFDISLAFPKELAMGSTTTTVGTPGNGNGHQVAAREEFYAGYNHSYKNRFADWPRMVNPTLAAQVDKQYHRLAITFATKYGEANRGRQRQIIECYFQTDGTDPTP